MYIDAHCHLDLILNSTISIKNILQNATSFKISKIVQVSASIEGFKCFSNQLFDLMNKEKNQDFPELFFTFGSSPNDLCDIDLSFDRLFEFYKHFSIKKKKLNDFILSKNLIAIGEIGLDYFHKFFEIEKQKLAFENYLKLSIKLNLPVMLHIRDAFVDAIEILKSWNLNKPIIFHCYSGDITITEKILSNFDNCYFSFAGNITYKKLKYISESLKIIPVEKILIETDSPFLAPVPYRGKDNLPWYIIETYKYISNLLNISSDKLIYKIKNNFKDAFELN